MHLVSGSDYGDGSVYGGFHYERNAGYSEVWVLSLPSFVWTKAGDFHRGDRGLHDCTVVGNRQLLSWGGVNMTFRGQDVFP